MIDKSFIEHGGTSFARVTFTIPNSTWADSICLVGDFNEWNRTTHPLRRDREGRWVRTVELELGRAFQFRYLRDGKEWLNDSHADAYVYNQYGSDNFVVVTDRKFTAQSGLQKEL